MELSAIVLSRVLAFVETFDLNPKGTIFYPDLVTSLVQELRFQKFPQKVEEFDENQGVTFLEGVWRGIVVEKLVIYNNALLIDTRAGTDLSKRVLNEVLEWATSKFGVNYKSGMIKRWRYLSDLTVISEAPLLANYEAATRLSQAITRHVSELVGEPFTYQPSRFSIDFERFARNMPMASFDIQRRADTPFSENKYFSEAPLPTFTHLDLLQEYEKDLLRNLPRPVSRAGGPV